MFKLLVFDVDNTLLNSQKEIPANALNSILKIKKNGYLVTIASGRASSDLKEILLLLHCDGPYISSSGACITDYKTCENLIQIPIPLEIKNQVVDIANNYSNLGIVFHYPEFCISDHQGFLTWQNWYGDTQNVQPASLREDIIPKPLKIDILGDVDNLVAIQNELIHQRIEVEISSSSARTLEINASGVNKGSGLVHLSELMHIPLRQIVVFGDSENDLPMFIIAGYSVCMGSNDEQLSGKAKLIAPASDMDGLSWALKRLFKDVFDK